MRTFRVAMAQINPTVGDLDGNLQAVMSGVKEARKAKADLVAFPELALTGYPPEDLLLKPRFIEDTRRALEALIPECHGLAVVVGYVAQGVGAEPKRMKPTAVPAGRDELYNAAAVIVDARLVTTYAKQYLPNYGVFDESRYFYPGQRSPVIVLNGTTIGVNICEDIWLPEGPTKFQAAAGAEIIVNINASPFHIAKSRQREQMLATRARDNHVIVTYTNTVGGQDELVFDGNSVVLDQTGEVVARAKAFEADFLVTDLNATAVGRGRLVQGRRRAAGGRLPSSVERMVVPAYETPSHAPRAVPSLAQPMDQLEEVYRALVLGVRDYVRKNRFQRAVIGLSGGVDSALTAAIAVDALEAANVLGLFMPSPFTSIESHEDVADLASRLGIEYRTVPIAELFASYRAALAPTFADHPSDVTEENLQARIRGNLLMAISNKFGHLVLTTGNKSELSVGYATLYGDMAGGFAVIKDVPKTMVYELARYRNSLGKATIIPKRVLERAPTAELRPNQRDEDSLPPYPVLDPILKAYVEDDRSPDEIAAMGFDRATVERVIALVDHSEYKRRQAPVGIKITHRGLGKDRRMPITNRYRG
ncbi:Glutamine-dependent NAD(+) synthetase [Nitrospira tepida]|uniref:Glutamine-dependent NAD(+) synthetase n=1 Tax=Nitrospira tepida TaxID=2973512 RepID=A0AA86T3Z4_9BACT|nr:NAD+ synthase [Nitrospira tepida]CAI4031278.1 Glutamine-dependent NAD(+) synthetase [Nitrospira tepida]